MDTVIKSYQRFRVAVNSYLRGADIKIPAHHYGFFIKHFRLAYEELTKIDLDETLDGREGDIRRIGPLVRLGIFAFLAWRDIEAAMREREKP